MMAILGLIFSATHTKETFELTKNRTIASLPIGGRYRLIDFTLSSMVNCDISHIGIVTKSNYQSLMDHIGSGKEWDLARKNGGLVILPPYGASVEIYDSRLEALKSIIRFINYASEEYVLLTDCYHLCNIDYKPLIEAHIKNNADITCVYRQQQVGDGDYTPVKTFVVDEDNRIVDMVFYDEFSGVANVSLDIWILKKEFLQELVIDSIINNLKSFNRDIIQKNLDHFKIYGYKFDGFFKDINSIKSYYDLNMLLLDRDIRNELFNKENFSVYTKVRDSAPTRYGKNANVLNSLIADGCRIEGTVKNSIIFRGVVVSENTEVNDSIIMQDTIITNGCRLNNIITDKNVTIVNTKELSGSKDKPIYIEKNEVL